MSPTAMPAWHDMVLVCHQACRALKVGVLFNARMVYIAHRPATLRKDPLHEHTMEDASSPPIRRVSSAMSRQGDELERLKVYLRYSVQSKTSSEPHCTSSTASQDLV
ncbi:hypothetical protein HBI56_230370 [Parastagonospora nodorum]|uniref:Uncharacterized protein n=1 Tax=Phaeosphaeria nodorum (strain SN15 / ATCC MYA-4574 / FGSC 10173) TaxID=321614 RepID=A0A7U2FFU8_PHANO|nr:hypothetical protein HBH56_223300 [Parastagonospora nodorum]QRD04378.1 hypothetical protein JI435_160980 [Parastagonospora nodorum SN15]KAH3921891.1 hypothetical protein HBH54_231450 [Parastagonospora nodorum]KAH3939474.1 hypothetical protein HBH53_235340 [Parastagonospora nodorum]KAH3957189.1 hypothetical protein HBH51_228710 [Parastagonospora nodorum]